MCRTCAILCACVPSGCSLPSRADLPSLARLPLVSRGVFIAGDYHSQGPDRVNGEETMTAAESAELAQRYDPRDVQEKWQARWEELDPFRASDDPADPRERATCWTCSPIRPVTCTWATPRRTRSATSSRATGSSAATTCCTRSAGTPSACPRRTPRSGTTRTRPTGPTRTSRPRRRRSAGTRSPSTGPAPADLRPGVLPLEPVAVPALLRARPGLPQGRLRQLVPEGPDRAGQRAGHRRPVRALRRRGHPPDADPVVLQDHRVRRPAAGRHGSSWRATGRTASC